MSEFSGSLRVPPQNIEAEQAVLGSMMLSKEAVSVVLQLLEPEFFYKSAHQKIFKAILTLEQGSEPVDQLTVSDILKRMGELEAVGGAYYITGLAESIPSTANVEYYARLVMEAATLRDIIVLAGTISTEAYEAKDHVDDVL
ncbi:MAG TPA: replicative DNA helicase, partial [Candidatus Marinimicrobia bacterium]|nr:replicative DNA helicase [Candidatus Neomarinimicrobiota bacterium]